MRATSKETEPVVDKCCQSVSQVLLWSSKIYAAILLDIVVKRWS